MNHVNREGNERMNVIKEYYVIKTMTVMDGL